MEMLSLKSTDSDFKLVQNKKKRKCKNIKTRDILISPISDDCDIDYSIRRIETAKRDILESDYYQSVSATLREALGLLENSIPKEIVCFGLGKISNSITARHQLGLLLCLKEFYNVDAFLYDPIFSENEKIILRRLGCSLLDENVEGKYRVKPETTTIFYLPHCPKHLTNNLLWVNWGLELSNCLIIANSFLNMFDKCPKKEMAISGHYISKILPYTMELAFINTFKYYDIFNDTSLHIFPYSKLRLILREFWRTDGEPVYPNDDVEFITREMSEKL